MKLNFALTRVLRENVLYGGALILFVVILLVVGYQQIQAIFQLNKKITETQVEIANLRKQNEVVTRYSPEQLDGLIGTLNQLLPNSEDYFSIFNSMEKMGASTGVTFTSFSSPFSGATADGVVVTAEAQGTVSSLLNFLDQYKLAGTRVATIEGVTISPPTSSAVFKIKFHSKPVQMASEGTNVPTLDDKMVKLLQDLETRNGPAVPTVDVDQQQSLYQSKQDPFGQ